MGTCTQFSKANARPACRARRLQASHIVYPCCCGGGEGGAAGAGLVSGTNSKAVPSVVRSQIGRPPLVSHVCIMVPMLCIKAMCKACTPCSHVAGEPHRVPLLLCVCGGGGGVAGVGLVSRTNPMAVPSLVRSQLARPPLLSLVCIMVPILCRHLSLFVLLCVSVVPQLCRSPFN